MNWNKLIYGVYAALFVGVSLYAAAFFLQMNRELNALRSQEAANRERLAAHQARLREQEEYLERLRTDPALVERVIRRKLGYTNPQEFVFRFQEPAGKD